MSASTTIIALAGIGAAGAAPLVTQWIDGRREQARLAHERKEKDIDELRGILDETAAVLLKADEATYEAIVWLEHSGKGEATGIDVDTALETLDRTEKELTQLLARIAIRVGRGPGLYECGLGARKAILELLALVMQTNMQASGEKLVPKESVDAGRELFEGYGSALTAFMDAAAKRVGAQG